MQIIVGIVVVVVLNLKRRVDLEVLALATGRMNSSCHLPSLLP